MASKFADLMAAQGETALGAVEGAKIDFAIELDRLLRREGMTKSQLAEAMGVSKPMVTKILRGDSNLTIDTMARAAFAAKGRLHIKIAHESCDGRWFEIMKGGHNSSSSKTHSFSYPDAAKFNWISDAANDHENQPVAA